MKKEYCFGIDVGGTTVKCGLFNTEGHCLDKWEIVTRKEDHGKNILPDIAKTILAKMAEKDIAKEQVAGIGMGIPGPVTEEGTVEVAVNLHWGYVEIVAEMEEMTGLPVMAGNDANVAALGEAWKGGGEGHSNLLMITLGTGVGGGVVINGRIVPGAHGAAGEIGHAHVRDGYGIRCNCGNYGCLEQFCSATGISRMAERILLITDDPSVLRDKGSRPSAREIFDAVKKNDPIAVRIATEFGEILGKTLATISCVVDPEIIVIGGGVSKAGPVLIDYIQESFNENAFPSLRKTQFALAKLGNDAGIYGAAKMVL